MDPEDRPMISKLRRKRPRNAEVSLSRNEKSLSSLAKKFISLIKESENQSIDTKEAATILRVPIRRIYDISNVLEGIGLVQKSSKNMIQWLGGPEESCEFEDPSQLEALEEQKLDQWINQLETSLLQLTKEPSYQNLSYISYNDIRSLMPTGNQPAIALHLPSETPIDSPSPLVKQIDPESVKIEFIANAGDISVDVVDKNLPEEFNTEKP